MIIQYITLHSYTNHESPLTILKVELVTNSLWSILFNIPFSITIIVNLLSLSYDIVDYK